MWQASNTKLQYWMMLILLECYKLCTCSSLLGGNTACQLENTYFCHHGFTAKILFQSFQLGGGVENPCQTSCFLYLFSLLLYIYITTACPLPGQSM